MFLIESLHVAEALGHEDNTLSILDCFPQHQIDIVSKTLAFSRINLASIM